MAQSTASSIDSAAAAAVCAGVDAAVAAAMPAANSLLTGCYRFFQRITHQVNKPLRVHVQWAELSNTGICSTLLAPTSVSSKWL
jgi:hypothetical protein